MDLSQNKNEIKRLIEDDAYRLRTLYKITTKGGKLSSLVPNSIQQKINQCAARRKMILKARQFGVTTQEVVKMLDYTLWNENRTACILAHEQDAIKKIFKICRLAHSKLPRPFNLELDRGHGSQYEMRFPYMNSKIYCDLESRGDTIHHLHVSEAAFVQNPDKVISTMQAVPQDGIITLESTPNGMGNYFYDMWMDPSQNFEKLFFPWFLFEEYQTESGKIRLTDEEKEFTQKVKTKWKLEITKEQIAYRRSKQSELKHLFKQEYPEDDQSCFLSSGNAAMDLVRVKELYDAAPSPIHETDILKIYRRRDRANRYVIGCDTSEGVRGDFSVAQVLEVETRKQVAILRGQFKPFEFAHHILELSKEYIQRGNQYPLVAVERNNHGHAVLQELHEHIRYQNLYVHTDDRLGWLTDRVTRPIMLDTLIDGVENGSVQLQDRTTLQECLTLVQENGKIEAGTGKHDDCVIASAIAVQMCIKEGSLSLYDNIGKMIRI